MAKPIPFFKDKVVLVTGASSGIGEEIALQLGRSGAKVTLAARRKERLENLAQTIAESGAAPPLIVECDVTVIWNARSRKPHKNGVGWTWP
jgi:NADP-dependent 3-hydroxy acid dehydrogenase YdfG